jgi:hypothetical protein
VRFTPVDGSSSSSSSHYYIICTSSNTASKLSWACSSQSYQCSLTARL